LVIGGEYRLRGEKQLLGLEFWETDEALPFLAGRRCWAVSDKEIVRVENSSFATAVPSALEAGNAVGVTQRCADASIVLLNLSTMSVATFAPGAGVTLTLGPEYAAAWIPEPIQHNPDAARHDPGEDKGVDRSVSVEIVEKLVHPPVSPALALHL
jgi:hypothetical protein